MHTFKITLSDSLVDPTVLPDGGHLGFGLRHEYPVNSTTDLNDLIGCLKGGDAFIYKICSQLSLKASLKVVYREHDEWEEPDANEWGDNIYHMMVDQVVELDKELMEDSFVPRFQFQHGGQVMHSLGHLAYYDNIVKMRLKSIGSRR